MVVACFHVGLGLDHGPRAIARALVGLCVAPIQIRLRAATRAGRRFLA